MHVATPLQFLLMVFFSCYGPVWVRDVTTIALPFTQQLLLYILMLLKLHYPSAIIFLSSKFNESQIAGIENYSKAKMNIF